MEEYISLKSESSSTSDPHFLADSNTRSRDSALRGALPLDPARPGGSYVILDPAAVLTTQPFSRIGDNLKPGLHT